MVLTMPQMPLSAASCVVMAAITLLLIPLIRAVTQEAVPSLRVELSEGDQNVGCCIICDAAVLSLNDCVSMQLKPKTLFPRLSTNHPRAQQLIKYLATTQAICSCWVTYQL